MANKKFWVGMLVMVLVFGMTVIGCALLPTSGAPSGFVPGGSQQTTIIMRDGIDFDETFRQIVFHLSSMHGYDMEMADKPKGVAAAPVSMLYIL